MGEEFTAVLVKGRSNYISLRRLDVAIQRQDSLFQRAGGVRPARHDADVVEPDDGRQSLRPGLSPVPQRLGGRAERGRQLPGPRVPESQGVLLLSGPAEGSARQHAGRQPCPVRHRPGTARRRGISASCPSTTWPILDEAHTFEAVAGEHLGLADLELGRRSHAGAAVQRAEPTRACWRFTSSTTRSIRCSVPASAAEDFFAPDRRLAPAPAARASTAGSASRSAARDSARGAAPAGRRRSTRAPTNFEKPEERIELDAARGALPGAGRRDLGVAAPDGRPTTSTGSSSRTSPGTRIRLASAPLDVGPSLRSMLFDEVADLRADLGDALRRLAAEVRLLQVPARP